jgi:type I restriction enzyme, S subunit
MRIVEEWETKRLDEIGTIFSGSTPSTTVRAFWDGEIVWVTPNDLSKLNTPYLHDSAKRITEKGLGGCSANLLPAGSLVMSSRAPIGYLALPSVTFCTNQGCKAIRLKSSSHPEFTYYNVLFNVGKIKSLGEGTTFAEISKTALSGVELSFPALFAEQAKIAEILSTVDRAIEQTEALIAKQRHIKTGLMQDLLTRGIDEHGNLRSEQTHQFKDSPLGRIPVEWEINKILETGSVTLGRQLAPKYMLGTSRTPYLRVANVFDGWIDFDDVLEMDFSPRERGNFFLRPGDILLNEGQSLELVGRSSLFSGPPGVFCFQNTLIRYRAFEGTLPAYARVVFKWWLDTGIFQEVSRQTTSVAHLGADRFAQMHFPRPCLPEQERIMESMLAHDSQVNGQQQLHAKYCALKTALMQDLLTGKKRVTELLEPHQPSTKGEC